MPLYLKSAPSKSFTDSAQSDVAQRVNAIIDDIRGNGDAAVRKYSEQFDKWSPEIFRLDDARVAEIMATLDQQVIDDIVFVQAQVRRFAQAQRDSLVDIEIETLPGVFLGQKHVPVQAAGAYIPGGKYPLTASAHMTIITAKVAGVPRVVACTPPIRGEIPPATVAAMKLAGADEIYVLGGVQAVTAMAVGTETIDPVNLIAGPGNAYVAEAKRQLFGEVGIDLFAGPTEILIVADDTADPRLVAADLISQAEHDEQASAVLVTASESLAAAVAAEIAPRAASTRHAARVAAALGGPQSAIVLVDDLEAATAFSNAYAPEHLELHLADANPAPFVHAGAVFVGPDSPVSLGDYLAGSNHVLPTGGQARYAAGLSAATFLRPQQVIEYDRAALAEVREGVVTLAEAEDLPAHGEAVEARFEAPPVP